MSELIASERWLPVPDWEGLYEVSDQGRVRSLDRVVTFPHSSGGGRTMTRIFRGKIMSPAKGANGYLNVNLSRDDKPCAISLHVTVLTVFFGPPADGMVCRHRNGVRTDCRLSNLHWGTRRENEFDKQAHGTQHQVNKERCPRRHLYSGPNLYRRRKRLRDGALSRARECLACRRASAAVTRARKSGRPEPDFDALADANYQTIMKAESER